jgi:7-cyano-7-deazaguanine synthase
MKHLLILSGGMDSAVLLAMLVNEGKDVTTLTFDYGAKHNEREYECVKRLAAHYKVQNVHVDLPFIGELFNSDLLKKGGGIPEGHYKDANMKRTVVPFRNGIMLSIATGYAESIGAKEVWFGAHAGDHAIYPDCRAVFVGAIREAIRLGTYEHLTLMAPFVLQTKREIGLMGKQLHVPFDKTYSCYNGREKHCGKCGTCTERKEALAGFDPTEYEE